jgi:hypothetical protein
MANTLSVPRLKKPVPLRFHFHDQQWRVVESPATELLVGGSLGGGKSWVCRALAVTFACAIPGLTVYIVRRTFGKLIDTHWKGPQSFPMMVADLVNARLCALTAPP